MMDLLGMGSGGGGYPPPRVNIRISPTKESSFIKGSPGAGTSGGLATQAPPQNQYANVTALDLVHGNLGTSSGAGSVPQQTGTLSLSQLESSISGTQIPGWVWIAGLVAIYALFLD